MQNLTPIYYLFLHGNSLFEAVTQGREGRNRKKEKAGKEEKPTQEYITGLIMAMGNWDSTSQGPSREVCRTYLSIVHLGKEDGSTHLFTSFCYPWET